MNNKGKNHKELKLVIVGNAPVLNESKIQGKVSASLLDQFIDSADIVIRMNDIKNKESPGIGSKTDILAVMNKGQEKYTQGDPIAPKLTKNLKEILFMFSDKENSSGHSVNKGKLFTDKIIQHQAWQHLKINYTIPEQMLKLEQQLNTNTKKKKKYMASTGIRTIEHILNDSRFKHHKVYIIGFGFKGWAGHNFNKEHEYINQLIKTKRIFVAKPPSRLKSVFNSLKKKVRKLKRKAKRFLKRLQENIN